MCDAYVDDTDTLEQAAENETMVNLTQATGEDDAGNQEDEEHVTKVDGIETARMNLGMLAWVGVNGVVGGRTTTVLEETCEPFPVLQNL